MDSQQAALVVMAAASLVLSAVLSFLNISGSGVCLRRTVVPKLRVNYPLGVICNSSGGNV